MFRVVKWASGPQVGTLCVRFKLTLSQTSKRVLSPELQECMDTRTKGALQLRAHTAKSPEPPKKLKLKGLSARGELAHQSGVNKRRRGNIGVKAPPFSFHTRPSFHFDTPEDTH